MFRNSPKRFLRSSKNAGTSLSRPRSVRPSCLHHHALLQDSCVSNNQAHHGSAISQRARQSTKAILKQPHELFDNGQARSENSRISSPPLLHDLHNRPAAEIVGVWKLADGQDRSGTETCPSLFGDRWHNHTHSDRRSSTASESVSRTVGAVRLGVMMSTVWK